MTPDEMRRYARLLRVIAQRMRGATLADETGNAHDAFQLECLASIMDDYADVMTRNPVEGDHALYSNVWYSDGRVLRSVRDADRQIRNPA